MKKFPLPQKRLDSIKEQAEQQSTKLFSQDLVTDVPLDKVVAAPWNARKHFDQAALEDLASSLKAQGLIQPIVLRPLKDQYELVAGERRFRAAKLAGFKKLKAYVRSLSDEEAQRTALSENLDREDLNAYEETWGYFQLLVLSLKNQEVFKAFVKAGESDELAVKRLLFSLLGKENRGVNNVINAELLKTVEAVFSEIGKLSWKSFVQNRLGLLDLPDDLLSVLKEGKLEYTKVLVLSKLEPADRKRLLDKALANDYSLSELKREISSLSPKPAPNLLLKRFRGLSKAFKGFDASDRKKAKKVEHLLSELEALLRD